MPSGTMPSLDSRQLTVLVSGPVRAEGSLVARIAGVHHRNVNHWGSLLPFPGTGEFPLALSQPWLVSCFAFLSFQASEVPCHCSAEF